MTKTKGAASLLLVAAASAACVTNGKDFRSDTSWIKKGTTKKSDVQMLLGEPYAVGSSGGQPTWTYGYYRYKLIGKSNQKELKFYFKPDGTVETFSFTSSFPEDTGAKPPMANSEGK